MSQGSIKKNPATELDVELGDIAVATDVVDYRHERAVDGSNTARTCYLRAVLAECEPFSAAG